MNEVSATSLQRKNQNLISEDKCTSHISLKLTAVRNKLATLCPLVELLPQTQCYLSNEGCWLCT